MSELERIKPSRNIFSFMGFKAHDYMLCVYVLVYNTPSLLRVLRVFQNQYKQISQNHPETPK